MEDVLLCDFLADLDERLDASQDHGERARINACVSLIELMCEEGPYDLDSPIDYELAV